MMTLSTNKNFNALVKAHAKTSKELAELKETMKSFKYSERTAPEYAALAEKEIFLNFKLQYEKENLIVCAGSYCLSILANIWKAYEGKKLGEKTKEKIQVEFYEATNKNFKFYVSGNRDICFIHLNNEGYTSYLFNYRELDFYLPYGSSYTDAENKIIPLNIENISQYHGIEEYKEPGKAARDMIKTARKAQEKANELNKIISELNKLHPQKNSYIKEYNEVRYIERL